MLNALLHAYIYVNILCQLYCINSFKYENMQIQYVLTNRRRAGQIGFHTKHHSRSAGCAQIDAVSRSTNQRKVLLL
jgi:hypothetical protein